MSDRFVGEVHLLEACGQPGCPVCRCVAQDSRQHLDGLLYELVTDPETRRRLRNSWGFCNWHTWMLLEIQGSRSGAAIIYEDLLGRLVEQGSPRRRDAGARAARGCRPLGPRAKVARGRLRQTCPACEDAAAAERRYLEAMLGSGDDADLQLAYARSDGLCGPHALRALASPPGARGAPGSPRGPSPSGRGSATTSGASSPSTTTATGNPSRRPRRPPASAPSRCSAARAAYSATTCIRISEIGASDRLR